MRNQGFKYTIIILSIYFFAYMMGVVTSNNIYTDIIGPIGTAICFFVIIKTFFNSKKDNFIDFSWIFLALASLSWAIADSIWAVLELYYKVDPDSSVFLTNLYLLPNIFIFFATMLFLIHNVRRWNLVQLALDVCAVCGSCLLLLWVIFFNGSYELFYIINQDGIISSGSIITDSIILAGVALWFLSSRIGKTPVFARITLFGVFLYAIVDLYYFYLYFYGGYDANSYIDGLYMFSFLAIALGAAYENFHSKVRVHFINESKNSNIGTRHNLIVLLLFPTLLVIFRGIESVHLFRAFIIIVIYEILSTTIQNAIRKTTLLNEEKQLNVVLEKKIEERTREIQEMNQQLIEKNKELDFLSNQDSITKLYNRRYFINAINRKIKEIKRGEVLAVLFVDMDRFKTINDTYGHDTGDQVLVELSKRFSSLNFKDSIVARLGGDEFVFALWGRHDYNLINAVATDIISCCNDEFIIGEYRFNVTLSIGISIYPMDADNCSTIMKHADMAMYHAKAQGFNKVMLFNSLLKERINRKNEIEILLKGANYDKEFMLFYQPQFSIVDKKLLGIEALLRWNSPVAGFIPPAEFIPIAEELDCIIPIGEWVMKEAVKQIAVWNRNYNLQLKMGINISPKQLDSKDFISTLKSKIHSEFADSKWLDIELTESIAIEDEYRISEISDLFQGVGTSISIDDFGTGYSSLSYLKMFPFDRIKIAKPLIDAISDDNYDMQIVKAIITLAKSIGIKTIAEGVETQEQMNILTELGCEEVQGYLMGKPMPPELFEEVFLKNIEKVST